MNVGHVVSWILFIVHHNIFNDFCRFVLCKSTGFGNCCHQQNGFCMGVFATCFFGSLSEARKTETCPALGQKWPKQLRNPVAMFSFRMQVVQCLDGKKCCFLHHSTSTWNTNTNTHVYTYVHGLGAFSVAHGDQLLYSMIRIMWKRTEPSFLIIQRYNTIFTPLQCIWWHLLSTSGNDAIYICFPHLKKTKSKD